MRAIPTMSLSDLIQRASTELNEAHKRADASKQKPVMKFSECELEVTVTFESIQPCTH